MAEKIPEEQQPKYERAWQIFHRFFDDDLEDLKRLARAAGSVDAALARRARVDAAVAAIEDILDRHDEIEQILEDARRRRDRWAFLKAVALAFATVVGILATAKQIIPAGWLPW
jgi:hypothetical protein